MNRRMILGVGTFVILFLTLGGYFLIQKASRPTTTADGNTVNPTLTPAPFTAQSLKDLFIEGAARQCTFSSKSTTAGTVYVGNGNFRVDVTTKSGGQTILTHMISDGKVSYVWMNDDKKGTKITFDLSNSSLMPLSPDSTQSGADINQNVNFNCNNWTVDSSQFAIPQDITFIDMTTMNRPSPEGVLKPNNASDSEGKAAQCAACNNAPADYKEQCLQSMGCI